MSYSVDGKIITGQDAANQFAKYFSSVFLAEVPKLDPAEAARNARPATASINVVRLDKKDLQHAVMRLKTKSATGPDGVPPFIVKDCINVLHQPLLHLFNL